MPRVEVVTRPASSPPPPEVSSAPPPEVEPTHAGCTLAESTTSITRDALAMPGSNLTTMGGRTMLAWAGYDANAQRPQPHGAVIDVHGAAVAPIEAPALTGVTRSLDRVSAMLSSDGTPGLRVDRTVREGTEEAIVCGNRRGVVALVDERGEYAEEGSEIHFDMASCRSVVAGDRVFVVSANPARDEDLFAGVVYLHAQFAEAGAEQFSRIWSYPESQEVFDRQMPWLRALAVGAPTETVATPMPGGGFALAWKQRNIVYVQTLADSLAPRGTPRVVSTRGAQPGFPRIAANARDVVAVFSQRASARGRAAIHAVRIPARGAPVHTVIAQGTEDAVGPSVIALGDDAWAIAWSFETPTRSPGEPGRGHTWVRMFDSTLRPIGEAQLVDDQGDDVHLAAFDASHVVVTTMHSSGSLRELTTRAARCVPAGAIAH